MTHALLKKDVGAIVLREGDLAHKRVFGFNKSGFKKVSPKVIVDREIRALELLADIECVQNFISRESDSSFFSKYMEGVSLKEWSDTLPKSYFTQLRELVSLSYSKGVYRVGHNRLHFIVQPDLRPGIVDYGNVVFFDDPFASVFIPITKAYTALRLADLEYRYVG